MNEKGNLLILWKVNNAHYIAGNDFATVEEIFKRHFPNMSINEVKKIAEILM